MAENPTALNALLRQRHWQSYNTFRREYDKAAAKIDKDLKGSYPSRAQLHRWRSGDLKGLPYSDHCRVLEAMFPGWTVKELLSAHESFEPESGVHHPLNAHPSPGGTADVTAVYSNRSAFAAAHPPASLFDSAKQISAAGLSLNVICQNYPDHQLRNIINGGTRLRCLFLDPHGEAVKAREAEEGHTDLETLTVLNINTLRRLRTLLDAEAADRLEIRIYDETLRFNILIIDGITAVVQPYMPRARGVDSPTLVMNDSTETESGLFPIFDQLFAQMWERSRPI